MKKLRRNLNFLEESSYLGCRLKEAQYEIGDYIAEDACRKVYHADLQYPVIIDFGLSVYVPDPLFMKQGTELYRTPELSNEPATTKSDIDSYGMLLYQCFNMNTDFKITVIHLISNSFQFLS